MLTPRKDSISEFLKEVWSSQLVDFTLLECTAVRISLCSLKLPTLSLVVTEAQRIEWMPSLIVFLILSQRPSVEETATGGLKVVGHETVLASVTGMTLRRLLEAMCGSIHWLSQHLGNQAGNSGVKRSSPVHNSSRRSGKSFLVCTINFASSLKLFQNKKIFSTLGTQ